MRLLAILAITSPLWAGPGYVGGGLTSGPNPQVNYTAVAGNHLVAGCYTFSATAAFSISDSAGQTWTASTVRTSTNHRTQMFYKENSAAVAWVKCTITNSGGTPRLVIGEYSGVKAAASLDGSTGTNGSSSNPATGAFSTTLGNLVVGFAITENASIGAGAGYTSPAELHDSVVSMEYQVIAGTSANAVWTSTFTAWTASGMGFLPAASSVGIPTVDNGAGTYLDSVTVTISDATPGAAFCYTTDGTDPTASTPGTCSAGSTYSSPVTLNADTSLKVLATKTGLENSAILTQTYIVRGPSSWYVSAAGSDSNTGADPSHTWAHAPGMTGCTGTCASNVLLPGDVIYLNRGDTWPDTTLTVPAGGSASAQITLTTYGSGAAPIISAPVNSPAIQAAAADRGYWTVDGLNLRASGTIGGINFPATIYHNYWDTDALPVPGWVVENCTSNAALFLFGPNTVVRGNAIDGTANSSPPYAGIVIRGAVSTGALIENNDVTHFKDRGIWILRGASNPVVRYNTVHDIIAGTDNDGMGINIDGYEIAVIGAHTYGNHVYSCAGIGITHENGIDAEASGNIIHDCTMGGVGAINYAAYQAQPTNLNIHHNVIYRVNTGIPIWDANTITIADNIIYQGTGTNSQAFTIQSLDTNVSALTFVRNTIAGAWAHPLYVRTNKAIWTSLDYNDIKPAGTEVAYQVVGGSQTAANLQAAGLQVHPRSRRNALWMGGSN